jgi:predicted nucleic acid-binding protein
MIYPDTSILVSLFLNEVRSESVVQTLQQLNRPLCLSEWTLHELCCSIARAFRDKRISKAESDRVPGEILQLVDELIIGRPLIKINSDQLTPIGSYILIRPELYLRAGDAFHLGIVMQKPDLSLLTSDKHLHSAAQALQIESVLID